MSRQTRTQRRAELAATRIAEAAKGEQWRDEYQSILLGLGPMILQNGLLPALAFLASKAGSLTWRTDADDPEERVLADLRGMLVDAGVLARDDQRVLQTLARMPSDAYARAQEEALAAVGWLKRFSLATWERKQENRS